MCAGVLCAAWPAWHAKPNAGAWRVLADLLRWEDLYNRHDHTLAHLDELDALADRWEGGARGWRAQPPASKAGQQSRDGAGPDEHASEEGAAER